jgi:hypothetical protein
VSFREDVFSDLQNDLCCPLLADEYFADINVFDYRKEEIGNLIEMSLSVATAKAGKIGVCVVVMPLVIVDDFRDADARHPRRITATYLVLENPLFNHGTNGTGKPALSVCSRLGHVLKNYVLGGLATGLVPGDGSYIQPAENPLAPIAYEVSFTCYENVDQNFVKCAMPDFEYDTVTGILTLSTATPDATIYYTLDGGYPHPTNPNGFTVSTYSGPITIEGEVLVRSGAFKEGYIPSNISAARFDRISDQLGDSLAEEGGGELTQS